MAPIGSKEQKNQAASSAVSPFPETIREIRDQKPA
jgi:hypothetical protein